ncbi:PAS domain-containing sensor histidine kinase [Acidobacteriota bacterium]
MENNRDKGSRNLIPSKNQKKKSVFFYGFVYGALLSVLVLVLSFLLPAIHSSNYYQRSLTQLRNKSKKIAVEFSRVIDEMNNRQKRLAGIKLPEKKSEIFTLFNQLNTNPEREGIGYYNKQGDLIIWQGNVIDLATIFHNEKKNNYFIEQESSVLIRQKTSVYLISSQNIGQTGIIVFYRLLAFLPQFETPYLKEYHFLKPKLQKNCEIDYWDFQEDVSGFEKIFSKYDDEYIGQPRLQNEIQTIFFPLRNKKNKIVATVTLSSPSLSSKSAAQKEGILLVFYLLLWLSLLFFLINIVKSPSFYAERKPLSVFFVILTLIGLRLLFFPISFLERIQSLSFFSPASASFLSFWHLTKSPADIFLTALFFFLIIACIATYSLRLFKNNKRSYSFILSLAVSSVTIIASILAIFSFRQILFRIVFHSNINLFHFALEPNFFFIHLSIFLFFLSFFLLCLILLRVCYLYASGPFLPLLIFFLSFCVYLLFSGEKSLSLLFFLQGPVIFLALFLSFSPKKYKKKEILFSALIISTLFVYISIYNSFSRRNHSLLQNSLQNIIKSQENWGDFLIQQSLLEIDKKEDLITSYLFNPESSDIAHSLWERTLIAKFNWYSSIEILSAEGTLLSSFSLNVPELFKINFDLPLTQSWAISQLKIPFLGKEKNFIIGHKDWFDKEIHIGRMIVYLSVDYDMLPFLYSANPYFELLRITSFPSLNQIDLGFAIFDSQGQLLFNPNKISSGISSDHLQKIQSSKEFIWSSFTDKQKKFKSLYFMYGNRIYSLFLPEENFLNHTVEFLKLFFLYLIFSLFFTFLSSIIFSTENIKNPLWSYSNRVYISFVAIALIPFLLFTLSTRSFFARIFTQQFTEKAEVHANFAQRVMEDFIFLQQEEQVSLTLPPESMVLWISSTISNDVNLYKDGRLISSSRREFFDSGLLPELINGEIFYKIQYENNPFYTQTQKIGEYSFHTLTIPYFSEDSLFLISLPFPLEQQEITNATEDLIEFLFFLSVFFLALVLLFARGIGGMIVNPIKKLLAGTKEVSLGNLEISIQHKHHDEMKTLIDGFNAMVNNLKQHQQDLAEMSKKVAWAEMARKVAHEIKNPLTPIQLSAEHLLRVYEDRTGNFEDALKESASYIIKEVESLRKIAQEFLEISKDTAHKAELLDLKVICQETMDPYKKILSERITFNEIYNGTDFAFIGDMDKIKVSLKNIFTNAIEAIQNYGEINITVSSTRTGLTLEIVDTGIGIEKDKLEIIFEPYFSTKDIGTGLGLPIAKKIIEDHGGSIKAVRTKNNKTKILIKFPKSITP